MVSQHTDTDLAFADMLAALGSATRLQLFRLLVRAGPEGRTVGAVKQDMGIPASTLAHHLGALVQAGLVEQTKVGREVRSAVSNANPFAARDNFTTRKGRSVSREG